MLSRPGLHVTVNNALSEVALNRSGHALLVHFGLISPGVAVVISMTAFAFCPFNGHDGIYGNRQHVYEIGPEPASVRILVVGADFVMRRRWRSGKPCAPRPGAYTHIDKPRRVGTARDGLSCSTLAPTTTKEN